MNLLYKLAKYKTAMTLSFIFLLGLVISPTLSLAADNTDFDKVVGIDVIEGTGDFADEEKIALGDSDLRQTIVAIINIALSMLGIVAVVVVLIGGFKWMTAGGDDGKVDEARKWIFSGIIGLAIILSAWAIARFALENLGKATNVSGFDVAE
ncbi:MAG: pilin [Candidatus Magasanikbacteria bacterium]